MPVRVPQLAAAGANSLWARILVAAIGAAAAAGLALGLLSGARKEQQGAAEGTAARWVWLLAPMTCFPLAVVWWWCGVVWCGVM